MILAFYSYKGGVGRTSVALDTAVRLATGGGDRPPLRVLVWDLDLDAPGVRHFPALAPAVERATHGTHDLLGLIRPLGDGSNRDVDEHQVRELLRAAVVTSPELAEGRLGLLLPAGSQTLASGASIPDPAALFMPGAPGPALLVLAADLARRELGFDVVVVDARTGINDLSATATTVLADCAVLVFRLDGQDVAHLGEIATAIHDAWERAGSSGPDLPNRLYRVANLVPQGGPDLEHAVARRLRELDRKRLFPHLQLPLRPTALLQESIPRLESSSLDPDADFAVEELSDWAYQRWADLVRREGDGTVPAVAQERTQRLQTATARFERKVLELLELGGWRAAGNPGEVDRGVDILAEKLGDFGRRQILLVQCKASARGASVADVDAAAALLARARVDEPGHVDAMLVARRFTPATERAARARDVLLVTPEALLDEQAPAASFRHRSRELWEGTAVERQYVEPDARSLDPEGHAAGAPAPLDDQVRQWLARGKPGLLCVLGDFGAGKTTFCRRLAAELAQGSTDSIPVYVDLRAAGSTAVTLDGLLRHALDEAQVDQARLQPWRFRLTSGSLVLLVDGFDELLGYTDPTRMEDLLDELQAAAATSRVVLTSRSGYFRSDQDAARALRGRRTSSGKAAGNTLWNRLQRRDNAWALEVQPFDNAKIHRYLELRFGTDRVADILTRLRALHPVDDLLGRPYLLTLVATSIDQWEERGWPDRLTLTSVYESYVADWLERDGKKHRGLPVEAASLAQHLGRVLWNRPTGTIGSRELRREASTWGSAVTGRSISPDQEDSIEAKVRTALFLVRDERGDYGFAHRSFLEFFVAKDLSSVLTADASLEVVQEALDLARLTPEIAAFIAGWPESWAAVPRLCTAVLRAEVRHPRASANALMLLGWHGQAEQPAPGEERRVVEVEGAQLAGVPLAGASIGAARLPGADLRGANLTGTDLAGADLRNADFRGTVAVDARLGGAILTGAQATGVFMAGADLSGARLNHAQLIGANLGRALLGGADLSHADLSGARLSRAVLTEATAHKTCLNRARLIGARLDRADLRDAALDGADARFASLRRTRLPADAVIHDFGARVAPEPDEVDGALVGHLRLRNPRAVCAISVDGLPLVAIGCADGTLQLWEPRSGLVRTVRLDFRAAIRSLCAVNGPRGESMLAVGDAAGGVLLWDIVSERPVASLARQPDKVRAICPVTLPNGSRVLAIAGGTSIVLASLDQLVPVQHLSAHQEDVRALCAMPRPDGSQTLVSASADAIITWDLETGEPRRLNSPDDWIRALCPVRTPRGTLLASAGDDGYVRLWDLTDAEPLVQILEGYPDWIRALCTMQLPDGTTALVCAGDEHEIWAWETDEFEHVLTEDHGEWVRSLCSLELDDGTRVLVSSGDERVRLWDTSVSSEPELLTELVSQARDLPGLVADPRSAGGTLATVDDQGNAWLWDVSRGDLRRINRGRGVEMTAWCPVTLAGDQPGFVLADDRVLRVWNVARGRTVAAWRHAGPMPTAMAQLTLGDRALVAVGSMDGTVQLRDLPRGDPTLTLGAHLSAVRALAGAAGTLMTAADGEGIHLWDAAAGSPLLATHLGGDTVITMASALLPDGSPGVASGATDGTVTLWTPAGEVAVAMGFPGGAVTALCPLSIAGQSPSLLVGVAAGHVLRWQPVTGDLNVLYAHDGPVRAICTLLAVDGQDAIASTGVDGTLRVCRPTAGDLTIFVTGSGAGAWMAYREGSVVGDGVAAWGAAIGLERLLLVADRWTAADVRVTHPDCLRNVRRQGSRMAAATT
jgi:uncharacterized protein YjbI with pentapeptide repeats/WD40 repeat protein/cellulose biosynthesis protein BcsQ